MAKDFDDDEFDDLLGDDDIDLGLGDLDFDGDENGGENPQKGGAFVEFGRGLKNTLFNLDTAQDVSKTILRRATPRGYVEGYDFVAKMIGAAEDTYNGILSDNAEELSEIADNLAAHLEGKELPPRLDRFIKDRREELEQLAKAKRVNTGPDLPSENDNEEELKTFLEESSINTEIRESNKLKIDAQRYAKDRADRIIQSRVNNAQLDRIASGVLATARGVQTSTTFDRKITHNYFRRSLQIQYKTFQALRDVRYLSNLSYKSTAEAFKKLIYNTSLPDIMRARTHERKMAAYYGTNASTIGNFNAGYWDKLTRNIRTGVSEKVSEAFQAIAAVTGDDLIAKQFFSSPGRAAGSLVGMGGSFILNDIIGPIIGDRLRRQTSKMSDRLGGFDHAIRHHVADIPGALHRFVDGQNGSNAFTSMLRGFLDQYLPMYSNNLTLDKTGYHNLDKPAEFTQAVQRSIVDIIPGYLSRIYNEIRVWRTGRSDGDVYDYTTGKFSSRQVVSRNLRENIVSAGDRELVQGNLERFHEQFDKDQSLSPEARQLLNRTLIKEAQSNHNFEPDRLLNEDLYEGADEKTRDEVINHIKQRYAFDENGNFAGGAENYARRYSDGRYYRELKEVLPNPTNDIHRLAGTGIYSELQRSGVIHTINGRETIQNDRLIQWMLEKPQTQGNRDPKRFGPFFKKGQIRPALTPLGFAQQLYRNKTSKRVIKELKDITGPVVDEKGNVILSYRDLRHGIRNASGKIVFRIGGALQDKMDQLAGRPTVDYEIENEAEERKRVERSQSTDSEEEGEEDNTLKGRARKRVNKARRQAKSVRDAYDANKNSGDAWKGGTKYTPSYVASVMARHRFIDEDDLLAAYLNDPELLKEDSEGLDEVLKAERDRLPRGIRDIVEHVDDTASALANGDKTVQEVYEEHKRALERQGRRLGIAGKRAKRRVKKGYEHLSNLSREDIQNRIREKSEALRQRLDNAVDAVDPDKTMRRRVEKAKDAIKRQFTDEDYEDFSSLIDEIENNDKMSDEEKRVAKEFVLGIQEHNRRVSRQRRLDKARKEAKAAKDKITGAVTDAIDTVRENEHVKSAEDYIRDKAKRIDESLGVTDHVEALKERAKRLDEEYDVSSRIEAGINSIRDTEAYKRAKTTFDRLKKGANLEELKKFEERVRNELGRESLKDRAINAGKRAHQAFDDFRKGGWRSRIGQVTKGLEGLRSRFSRQEEEGEDNEGVDNPPIDNLHDLTDRVHAQDEANREAADRADFDAHKQREFDIDQGVDPSPFVPRNAKEARRQMELGLSRDRRRKRKIEEADPSFSGDEFSDSVLNQKALDIYVGGESEPIIKRRELLAGSLFDYESHKPIRSIDDINGIVVDRYGNIVLDSQDIANGLYTMYGDRLTDTERTLKERFGKNLEDAGLTRKALDSIRGMRNFAHRQWLPGLIHGICDIYVKGEDIPRMTAKGMRLRQYVDLRTGRPIDSTKDITGSVVEGNEVIINEEEVKNLVDSKGRKIFIQGSFTKYKRRAIKAVKDSGMWMAKKYINFTRWYYEKLFDFSGRALKNMFFGEYSGRMLASVADVGYRVVNGLGKGLTHVIRELFTGGFSRLGSTLGGVGRFLSGGRLFAKVGDGLSKVKDGMGRIGNGNGLLSRGAQQIKKGYKRVKASVNTKALRTLGSKIAQLTGRLGDGMKRVKSTVSKFASPLIEKGKKALAILGLKARSILKRDGRSNLTSEQKRDPQLGLLAGINDKIAELLPKKRRKGNWEDIEKESEDRLKKEKSARKKGPMEWISSIFGRKKNKKGEGSDGDGDERGSRDSGRRWGESQRARDRRHEKSERRRSRDAARDRRDRMQGRSDRSRAVRRTGRAGVRGALTAGSYVANVLGEAGLSAVVGEDKANDLLDKLTAAQIADDLLLRGKGTSLLGKGAKTVVTKGGGWMWRAGVGVGRFAMRNPWVAAAVVAAGSGVLIYKHYSSRKAKEEMEFVNFRMAQYGVYGDEDLFGRTLKLEEDLEKHRKGKEVDYDYVAEDTLGKIFNVENASEDMALSVKMWYTQRFIPVHRKHIEAIEGIKPGTALSDVGGKLSAKEMLDYLSGVTFPTTGETPYNYNAPLIGKGLPSTIGVITDCFDNLKARISKENDDDPSVYNKLDHMGVDGSQSRKARSDTPGALNLTDDDPMKKDGIVKSADRIAQINAMEGVNTNAKTVRGGFSAEMKRQEGSKIIRDYLRPIQQIRYYAYGNVSLTRDVAEKMAAVEDLCIPLLKYTGSGVSLELSNEDYTQVAERLGIVEPDVGFFANIFTGEKSEYWDKEKHARVYWFNYVFQPVFLAWANAVDALKKNYKLVNSDSLIDYEQQYDVGLQLVKAMGKGKSFDYIGRTISINYERYLTRDESLLLWNKVQSVLDDLKKAKEDKPVQMEVAKPSQQTRQDDGVGAKPTSSDGWNTVDGNKEVSNTPNGNPLGNPGDSQGGYTVKDMANGTPPSSSVAAGSEGSFDNGGVGDGLPPMTGGDPVAMSQGEGGEFTKIPLPKKDGSLEAAKPTMEAISKITGVDLKTLLAMAGVESGFRSAITAGTSSATGWFQMINSTWKSMVNSAGKKYGIKPWTGPGRDPRMADPRINGLMGAEYVKGNYEGLKKRLGREPTAGDLYMAHFLGLGGASKILSAPRDAIAAQVFPEEAKANIPLFYMKGGRPRTVQGLIDFMTGKLYNFANKHLGGLGGEQVSAPATNVDPLSDPSAGQKAPTSADGTSKPNVASTIRQEIAQSPDVDAAGVLQDKPADNVALAKAPEVGTGMPSSDTAATPASSESAPGDTETSTPATTPAAPVRSTSPQENEERKRQDDVNTMSSFYEESIRYQKQIAENTGTIADLLRSGGLMGKPQEVSEGSSNTTEGQSSTVSSNREDKTIGNVKGSVNNSFHRTWS